MQKDQDPLLAARGKLQKKISDWKSNFFTRFPHFDYPKPPSLDPPLPEADSLFMPSMLNDHTRHAHGLQVLADTERRLRKGQASDALDKLRMSILTWNLHFEFKKLEVHGQQQNTRAQHLLKMLRKEIVTAAETYRRARDALLHLGMDENDATFRPLLDSELYLKNTSKPAKLGDNRKEDPWFWYAGRPDGISSSAWAIESKYNYVYLLYILMKIVDRVKWFRDRAARDRAREEKEILESEFKRSLCFFSKMADIWTELAKQDIPTGYCSYAYRQASMYDGLHSQCQHLYLKACALRHTYDSKVVSNGPRYTRFL